MARKIKAMGFKMVLSERELMRYMGAIYTCIKPQTNKNYE
jgi:hypothetical protein